MLILLTERESPSLYLSKQKHIPTDDLLYGYPQLNLCVCVRFFCVELKILTLFAVAVSFEIQHKVYRTA